MDILVLIQQTKIILKICMGKQHKHQICTTQNKILLKSVAKKLFVWTSLAYNTPMASEAISLLPDQDYDEIITPARNLLSQKNSNHYTVSISYSAT